MNEFFCHKHNITPADEKWKVTLEELTDPDDENGESFRGQVCPLCYLNLRDRMRELKRNLKIESREAIALRAENDHLNRLLDAVVLTVKQLTGKDAKELASQEFPVNQRMGIPFNPKEKGNILNILPNLIVEAAHPVKVPEVK